MNIAVIDVAIIFCYLIFTLFIAVYVSKKVSGFEDFALGGRSFGPFAMAATFGATNFSTWSMVGKPGFVYSSGISVVWIALNACACVDVYKRQCAVLLCCARTFPDFAVYTSVAFIACIAASIVISLRTTYKYSNK